MDTTTFDDKIRELEKNIIDTKEQLEITRGETCDIISKIVIYWFNYQVETALTSNPERAKSYGVENLRVLKSDLSKLIESTPELIDKHVNDDRYWPHCKNIVDEPYHLTAPSQHEFPERLYDSVREIFWYVVPILDRHGFSITGYNNKKYMDGWILPKEMFEELTTIRKKYEKEYRSWESLNNELLTTRRRKSDAEIKDLWEKV